MRSRTTTRRRAADHEEILALRLRAHQARRAPRRRVDRRHALAVRRPRAPPHVPVRRADRRLRARDLRRRRSGPEPVRDAGRARGARSGCGTRASSRRARARCIRTSSAPGLYVPLMPHSCGSRCQSGHRFVLGACDDELLGMYREMGFEVLEERIVEPKPGWRFRSHLICSTPSVPTASAVGTGGGDAARRHVLPRRCLRGAAGARRPRAWSSTRSPAQLRAASTSWPRSSSSSRAAVRRATALLRRRSSRPRSGRGFFYPWRRRLVHVLPEPLHRELRLDRNRYAITAAEQERLAGVRVAVGGPVGRPRGGDDAGARGRRRRAAARRLRRARPLEPQPRRRRRRRRRREQGRARRARGRRARSRTSASSLPARGRGGGDRGVRRRRRRGRRRVRRAGDEGAPARAGARSRGSRS